MLRFLKEIAMEKAGKKMSEMNRWVRKVKDAQEQIKSLVGQGNWMDEARKYAERQSKEVKKLIHGDMDKLRTFVVRERRELEKLQKQIPAELNRWKKYLGSQRKELENVLTNVTGQKKKVRAKSASKSKASGKAANATVKTTSNGAKNTAKRAKKAASAESKSEA